SRRGPTSEQFWHVLCCAVLCCAVLYLVARRPSHPRQANQSTSQPVNQGQARHRGILRKVHMTPERHAADAPCARRVRNPSSLLHEHLEEAAWTSRWRLWHAQGTMERASDTMRAVTFRMHRYARMSAPVPEPVPVPDRHHSHWDDGERLRGRSESP